MSIRVPLRGATAFVIAVSAAGCASVPDDAGFSAIRDVAQEREGKSARWRKGERDADADKLVRDILARELDVDGAVQVALLRNARLQELYEELEVGRAELVQAMLPQNPEVDLAVRLGLPSIAAVETDVSIVEDVVSLLFIPLRARLAGAELEVAKLHVSDAVLAHVAVVKDAYFSHVAARELLALQTTYAVAADAAAELAERQLQAGTENELFRATRVAESLQARLDTADAEMLVTHTKEELLRAMGLFGEETKLRIPAQLPTPSLAEATLEALESRAVAARLDLAAEQANIEVAAQRLALAQPWYIPFFNAGVEFESEGDEGSALGPRVGFAVPVFDWGQARRAALEANKRAVERRVEALAIEVRSQVREAAALMVTARAKVDFITASLLPARQAQLEQSLLHYNRMMIGVFDLLRARQELLDAERRAVVAREDYWRARAALERAVGGRMPVIVDAKPKTKGAAPAPAGAQRQKEDQPQQEQAEPAAGEHDEHGDQ